MSMVPTGRMTANMGQAVPPGFGATMTGQQQPMGSSFFQAVNPAMGALSKFGTALAAGFAKDPRQREMYQIQQAQQMQAEQQAETESVRNGIEMWMSSVQDLQAMAEQPGSEALFNSPSMQQMITSLKAMGGEYAVQANMNPALFEQKLDQIVRFGMMPKGAEADPYTLSPGQTRFGPDNQPIASLPDEPPAIEEKINAFTTLMGREPTDQEMIQMFGAADQSTKVSVDAREYNKGANNVVYPTPKDGFDYARNPDGTPALFPNAEGYLVPKLIRLEGGDPAAEAAKAAEIEASQAEQTVTVGNVVLQDIGRTKAKIEGSSWFNPATGTLGNILKDVGGTTAADAKALTDTVRANIGFDRLQAMRQASPTGGALGNITEKELGQLQATLGSLDQSQTEEQLLYNLDRLDKIYRSILKKANAYPNAGEFGFGGSDEPAPAGSGGVIEYDAQGNRITQ